MGEVTSEEIVKIATSFLLNAPPGEFMEVVQDVRTLLGANESLINGSAPETFREYNTSQMLVVDSPAGHKALITKYNEVADGEYLDPRGGVAIQFDHISQAVSGSRDAAGEGDQSVEGFRQQVEAAAVKYADEHYPNGAVGVYGHEGRVVVCISSAKFNPSAFWTGRWRSSWTIGNDGKITGVMNVNVHYYEDGNVQLNTNTPKTLSYAAGNAEAALKEIKKAEQGFHSSLDTSYATMGDTTYKALRRALPVIRTKVNWPQIEQYRLGKAIQK